MGPARNNPNQFFIGIDPDRSNLEKISEKIYRKPSKGGTPNALFVQAALDDLPAELECLAEEVHIQFPWGSLLRAVAEGEQESLAKLNKVCRKDALLKVVLGLDPIRDRSEMERLKIPAITSDYITGILNPSYEKAGFQNCGSKTDPGNRVFLFEIFLGKAA